MAANRLSGGQGQPAGARRPAGPGPDAARGPDPGILALARELLDREDELSEELVKRITTEVAYYYTSEAVSAADLRSTWLSHLRFVLGPLGSGEPFDTTEATGTGRRRAVDGVPLPAVMDAYRIGCRYLWEMVVQAAETRGDVSRAALLQVTSEIWLAQDVFTQAMASGYRDEMTSRLLQRETERSALVEALLRGQLAETGTLWEIADLLDIPQRGPYVVVAAEVPQLGRHALPAIESRLLARDFRSAWRLLPDLQIGIVFLPDPTRLGALVELLGRRSEVRQGISPPYTDLGQTGHALRFARIALTGSAPGQRAVTVFDEAPLSVAAVSAPDVMQHISRSILGPLDGLPAADRAILLETLEAWLDSDGSAAGAAQRLYCHPNTVRHRLRRLEERTGRSLLNPRHLVELSLALQTYRRLPAQIQDDPLPPPGGRAPS